MALRPADLWDPRFYGFETTALLPFVCQIAVAQTLLPDVLKLRTATRGAKVIKRYHVPATPFARTGPPS